MGFSTMPILWNGNNLNPDTLKPAFRPRGDAYVKAIVEAIKDEPGLLMWDIMNEPFSNSYYEKSEGEEKQREAEITGFVRYYLSYVKKLDPVNAITVGYRFSSQLEPTADLVDVLSFHDYTALRSTVEEAYRVAEEVSKKCGKPILNTETGCIARANPYDMVLEIAEKHKTGWYLFNLIIQGYWGEIHGLFYPDGTVRDPAIVAAVMGFYRNRDLNTIVRPVPNREGHADRALEDIEAALKDDPSSFGHTKTPTDKILDAAEEAANLLEAAEMVPMYAPPSAQIRFWREQLPDKRDRDAIRAFTYELGLTLKKSCLL
jgi:Cellulase (glycosyl hydrolase family 5)